METNLLPEWRDWLENASDEEMRQFMKDYIKQPMLSYEQAVALRDRALHPPKKSRKGFAAMDPERQREIAALGGKAAHASGRANRWTSEKAAAAGRIGGKISRKRKKEQE